MPVDDILLDAEESMEKAVDHLKHELRAIRTGRATPALVENIRAEYYGSPTEIRAMASIAVPEATQLLIKPFDPSSGKLIEKAINDSKLGVTVLNDGKTLRIKLPPLSQERRLQLAGQTKQHAETAKIAIRNARRDANKLVETEAKGGVMTEDEAEKAKEDVQELTKTYEGKIEETVENKRKEIMEV
jgi:ribosome recycling factor